MKAVRLVFSSILLTALCAFAVFGAGKKEAPLTEAAGLRNWEKTFDISDKKPGIYNIVVEGRDQAGNVTVAGPINVYVDPKTDLPVAAIANPIPLMRVSGDLNVVGTCVDDDGVAKVELRLDGSEWFSTQGTTFWSFLYKGTDIADGRHTLWARGVDINGLTGPERSVAFDMDKRRPVETVEQPVAGTLVSGRIALRGSVFDANGVASVECSLDSGKTFAETSGSYDKNKGIRSFVAQIDTNKIPDGPSVVLLKSKDGVGSVALAPILLVVDNTKPTIELISPAAEESVDGTFALFGYAKDEVGLKSVNWKIGDQGGDIVVNPGDPFWVVPVKLSNPRGRETTVILTAVDTIGNRTELRKRIALDLEADKPRVTLLSPAPTLAPAPLARTEGNALLAGFARDDDGVAAIEYWIDSQAPKKIETSGTFCIRLTDIPPGKRMLSVRAIDINGVVGPTTATQIEDIGAAPSVEIKDVVYDSASKDARVEPFQSGVELAPDGKASFRFIVKNSQANGSKIPAVEWKLTGPGGAQGVSGTAQVRSADGTVLVPLPKDSPFGMLELTATVKDSHSRGASAVGLVRVLDYSAVRGAPGFIFADERLAGENTIRFAPTDHGRRPLRGRFVGAVLSSLSLDPASSGYDVSFDGPYISLTPKGDGVNGKFTLVAKTDRGHEFRSREYHLFSDLTGPRLSLNDARASFVGSKAVVSGVVEDPSGVETCSYSLGAASDPVVLHFDPITGRFDATVDLSGLSDGPVRFTLKAVDRAGNESVATIEWYKDSEGPAFDFLLPDASSLGIAAGYVRDSGGVASLSFAPDGVDFTVLEDKEAFVVRFDPALASRARFKAIDRAGNERLIELPASAPAAPTADGNSAAGSPEALPASDPKAVPVLTILSPAAEASVSGNALVVFKLSAPRAPARITWSFGSASGEIDPSLPVPQNAASAADRGGDFVYAIVAKGIAARAGSPQLRLTVKDVSGKSASVSVSVKAEPEKLQPVLTLLSPAEDETAKASVLVSASAVSVRGTASYKFVLDGGEPRTVEAAGAGILKLEGLASGRHTITAVAVDSFGVESPQIKRNFRVVGDAPVISVGSIVRRDAKEDFRPGLGVAIESGTRYEGHVKAPNGLSSVEINVAGRAAVRASVKKETPTDFSFSIPLPVDLPFDRIDLSFKALDRAGFTADATTFFHRVSSVPASGVFEAPGLYLADRRVLGSEAIRVGDDLPFRLRFLGRPIASVVLDPPTGLLSAVAEGQTVVLSSVSDGSVGPTTVKLRDADGDEFTWGPYSFEIHRSDPKLEITSPAPDGWYREKTAFSALVSDSAGESVLSYSPDGTTWLPIAAEKKDNAVDSAGTKATTVDLPLDGPDGGVLLRFRASNASGRTVIVERVVNKDTATPVGSVVAPRSTDAVNGRTTLASRFTDAGKLASVEFSLDGKTWEKAERIDFVSRLVDYSAGTEPPSPLFRATDAAGNVVTLSPAFIPDVKADKPRTLVQLPEEGEVLRSDFAVSGAAFDDDAVAAVHYRFDGGEWKRLALEGNGFSIPVAFASESDNEHTVEVYAEDIYGVTGDLSARKYRVSKEEPKASIAAPRMDMTVRGILEIRGAATDANGIGEVELSFDNAATFNRAIQLPSADPTVVEWSYRLDTRILKDGLHSMYVRPKDAYETDGFFASLVSVDNTPPELSLDLPLDGAVANGKIELSGRATDTRALGSLSAVVYPLGASSTSERRFDLDLAPVVSRTLDLAGLSDGSYGLRLVAVDKAGNKTVVTRDFSLKAGAREEFVALSSPVSGERLAGKLRVQGRLRSPARVSSVTVLVDGADFLSVKPDKNGWFSADLVGSTDTLPIAAGRRSIEVRFLNDEGKVVTSGPVEVDFASEGPWVLGDSWAPGSYIPYRPYLSGTAGWTTAPATQGADAAAARAAAAEKRGREVVSVEVSVDNGRTFTPASGRDKWRFRLETQGFPEGTLPVLARAHFRNGEIANSKLYLNLDKTTPKVTIVSPGEGGRFNGKIDVSGVASDDVELVSVSLAFRDGNKAGYELPSFIQGMYVDAHILGEPSYEIGAGFTFFGDNVKLQFAYGYTPDIFLGQDRGRFHGNVFSAKLLANLFSFPFAFWLGPDWEFLSANFAIGANFSYFTQTQSTTLGTSSGTVIGAVIGQIEFPKMKFKNLSMFRSYSFYVEGQAWFVSAELDGGVKPAIAMGLRVGIF